MHVKSLSVSMKNIGVCRESAEIEIRQLFVEIENTARELGLQINQEETKYMIME
jgi:hypothetical protein